MRAASLRLARDAPPTVARRPGFRGSGDNQESERARVLSGASAAMPAIKKVKIAPEPEQESAPLNPLNVDSLDGEQNEPSNRGVRMAELTESESCYQSQFQLWDSHVIEEGGESMNGIQAARHPGWATFDKENLASMECFGGMLTRTLEPCPKVCCTT